MGGGVVPGVPLGSTVARTTAAPSPWKLASNFTNSCFQFPPPSRNSPAQTSGNPSLKRIGAALPFPCAHLLHAERTFWKNFWNMTPLLQSEVEQVQNVADKTVWACRFSFRRAGSRLPCPCETWNCAPWSLCQRACTKRQIFAFQGSVAVSHGSSITHQTRTEGKCALRNQNPRQHPS